MTTSSQTQPLPRRSESGLHTRAVNAAAGVLLAAMQQGQQTPTGLALALDSARLLNSPEHAARFKQLEARVAELARPAIEAKRTEIRESLIALAAQAEADRDFEGAFNVQCRLREHEELWKREDEEQRPADGLAPATCGRALSTGQPCPDHPDTAEVETLRARVAELEDRQDRHRAELTALRTDALAIRGVLAPAGRPRRVPFELGATLLPAVEWLLARIAELEAQLAEYEEPLDESPIPYALTTKAAAVRAEEADR